MFLLTTLTDTPFSPSGELGASGFFATALAWAFFLTFLLMVFTAFQEPARDLIFCGLIASVHVRGYRELVHVTDPAARWSLLVHWYLPCLYVLAAFYRWGAGLPMHRLHLTLQEKHVRRLHAGQRWMGCLHAAVVVASYSCVLLWDEPCLSENRLYDADWGTTCRSRLVVWWTSVFSLAFFTLDLVLAWFTRRWEGYLFLVHALITWNSTLATLYGGCQYYNARTTWTEVTTPLYYWTLYLKERRSRWRYPVQALFGLLFLGVRGAYNVTVIIVPLLKDLHDPARTAGVPTWVWYWAFSHVLLWTAMHAYWCFKILRRVGVVPLVGLLSVVYLYSRGASSQ